MWLTMNGNLLQCVILLLLNSALNCESQGSMVGSDHCPARCNCTEHTSTMHTIVNCTDGGWTDLPYNLSIINPPGYKYYLDFSNNKLSWLGYKDYVENTTAMDVSNSGVEDVDWRMWRAFAGMANVSLKDNLITQLPTMLEGNPFHGGLDIRNNPIACDCDKQWMKFWLISMGDRLADPAGIRCRTPAGLRGRSVVSLTNIEFCPGAPRTGADVVGFLSLVAGSILAMVLIVVFLLRRMRLQVFAYLRLHPFDRDECEDEAMDYDVYLSLSKDDAGSAEELVTWLEQQGYRVFYPERDIRNDIQTDENIAESIARSKRVLCLLTRNFVGDDRCMEELRAAYYRDIEKVKKRTILVLNESIQRFESDELIAELRDYHKRYPFIKMGSPGWKNRISYAMPIHKISGQ